MDSRASSNTSEKSETRLSSLSPLGFTFYRAAEKAAAAAAQSDDQPSDEEPAPTSDVERPDDSEVEESKPKPKPKKKGKGKGKGKGGVAIPDDWPWEQAKKIFMEPDVLPADQVEVSANLSVLSQETEFIMSTAGLEKPRCRRPGTVLGHRKRIQVRLCDMSFAFISSIHSLQQQRGASPQRC